MVEMFNVAQEVTVVELAEEQEQVQEDEQEEGK